MGNPRAVLFLANNQWSKIVVGMIETYLPDHKIEAYWLNKDDKIPTLPGTYPVELCLSFLCPRIIPAAILNRSKLKVNFHPGDRHFPGIGCYNFALYEGCSDYGVVCHHMAENVDTGDIILEKKFAISPTETVDSLQFKSFCSLLHLCQEFLERYVSGVPFEHGLIKWTRRPYSRKDLDALLDIPPNLAPAEIKRRQRATAYPGYEELIDAHPLIRRVFDD